MQRALLGQDLLSRSLRISWIVAAALAALLLPSRAADGFSVLAGQLIAFLNFIFLREIVKLFTDRRGADVAAGAAAPQGRIMLTIGAKLLLVYGGCFALMQWAGVRYVAFSIGLALPLITLFLKSVMLALGRGPASFVRRATTTVRSSTNAAKLAALIFIAAAVLAPSMTLADEHSTPGSEATETAGAVESGTTAEGHGGAEVQELPNWLVILNDWNPDNPVVHWLEQNQILVFAWVAGFLFLGISWFAMRKPKMVPGPLQNAIEWLVESMEDVCGGLLGSHIGRHFPFVGALFFYILTINLLGIFPGFKSATSSLDLTLALALITFVYVQFWGIRNLGILGYMDHLAGSPRDAIGYAMLPVMVPVHILGELAKPVSLSCRLFGNIFGEDTLIVVFVGATALCLKASLTALAVPPMLGISALFMMLQTLTSIVQALIFSLLATVYLYMMLPHEEHAHGEAEHAH